jgi:hypothetical protein
LNLESQAVAGERQALLYVFFFLSVASSLIHTRNLKQWFRRRVIMHEPERPGQVKPVSVRKRHPVLIRQTRNLERVAGDHLQVEPDMWPRRMNRVNHLDQIKNSLVQRHLRKKKTFRGVLHRHILEMRCHRKWGELFDHLHGCIEQRDVVACIETCSQELTAVVLQQVGHFVRSPVLVILKPEWKTILFEDWHRERDPLVGQNHEALPVIEARERLVPPPVKAGGAKAHGSRLSR